jgi:hypothetical protein
LLLTIGPATAGTGLLLLSFIKQTAGPSAYFTTFFPGVMVLGLGMSFTVAPLTATVMGAVSKQFSGTASGVNNALSRISGVFANAVFGALAVLFFTGALQNQLAQARLNELSKQAVMQQAIELGNAKAPAALSAGDKEKVQAFYHRSFIDAYGKIMRMAALLGFASALTAFVFIRNSRVRKQPAAEQ